MTLIQLFNEVCTGESLPKIAFLDRDPFHSDCIGDSFAVVQAVAEQAVEPGNMRVMPDLDAMRKAGAL